MDIFMTILLVILTVVLVILAVVLVVLTGVLIFLTLLLVRSGTKPRIVIDIPDKLVFTPGQRVKLRINLRNRPFWYARPTATDVLAFVNVDAAVQPLRLSFGTQLSNFDDQVKIGKNNSRYPRAFGIMLLPDQLESVEWNAAMPAAIGDYKFWIDLVAKEGLDARPYRAILKVR
jgi:hypothetical protein